MEIKIKAKYIRNLICQEVDICSVIYKYVSESRKCMSTHGMAVINDYLLLSKILWLCFRLFLNVARFMAGTKKKMMWFECVTRKVIFKV